MELPIFEWMSRRRSAPAAPLIRTRRSRRRSPTVLALEERRLLSISIVIDYSYDTTRFFDTTDKRNLMQMAANVVASALGNDHLTAIVPSAGDDWTARF